MTAEVVRFRRRLSAAPKPAEPPLIIYPNGIDDLWPSPDHWRSLDPPRDIKATGDREDET